jgi:hypothetical protein
MMFAQAFDLLDDAARTDLQSRQLREQPRDLPQRQAVANTHHRRRRQGVQAELRVWKVRRRRLLGST